MEDIISEIKSVEEESERKIKEVIANQEKELLKLKSDLEMKITETEKKQKQAAAEKFKETIQNFKSELDETYNAKKEKSIEAIKEAEKNIPKAVEFILNYILHNLV